MLKHWCWILLFLAISCKHDDTIGTSIIPENSGNPPFFNNSTKLISYTVREDSLRSDELGVNIAGHIENSQFGTSNNSFSFQVELPNNDLSFGNNPVLDSMVLCLAYNGSYGDLNENGGLIIKVASLEERIHKDSTYYSNNAIAFDNTSLAQANMTNINIEDSIMVNGVNLPPHLRMVLDSSLGQDILNKSGATELSDNENFFDFIMGFHIKSDTNQGNAMLYFGLKKDITKLILYYHNDDSTNIEAEFKVDNEAATQGYFEHNYTSSSAETLIENPDTLNGDSILFIQSNAGLKSKIEIPDIDSLGEVIINKAELVLTIDGASDASGFELPQSLICLSIDSLGQNAFIADQFESSGYYGGSKTSVTINGQSTTQYHFNLAYHIQELVNKEKENRGLYILTFPSSEIADQLILKGNQSSGIELNLTYTKIK